MRHQLGAARADLDRCLHTQRRSLCFWSREVRVDRPFPFPLLERILQTPGHGGYSILKKNERTRAVDQSARLIQ